MESNSGRKQPKQLNKRPAGHSGSGLSNPVPAKSSTRLAGPATTTTSKRLTVHIAVSSTCYCTELGIWQATPSCFKILVRRLVCSLRHPNTCVELYRLGSLIAPQPAATRSLQHSHQTSPPLPACNCCRRTTEWPVQHSSWQCCCSLEQQQHLQLHKVRGRRAPQPPTPSDRHADSCAPIHTASTSHPAVSYACTTTP
jgi:hypothetical protein